MPKHRNRASSRAHTSCPYCFESSGFGYRIVSGGWSEPDYAEPDPNDPCPHCNGTGSVDAVEAGPPEEWDDEGFDGDGYLAALDRQASAYLSRETAS